MWPQLGSTMSTTTYPSVDACFESGWFDASVHPEYIDRDDAVVAADGTFFCTCPYAVEIHEVVKNRVFTTESYRAACEDI